MSTRLLSPSATGGAMFFLLFCTFLSQHSFAQVTAPAVTVRQGVPANGDWYQKLYYANGTFIALTLYPAEFFSSTDGVNWNRVTEPPELGYGQPSAADAYQIPDIAYGAGRWVIVSDSGKIFSSPDLVNWMRDSVGTLVTLNGVDYADSLFFATGDSATLFSSPDGITWTRQTISPSNPATDRFFHAVYGNGVLLLNSNGFDNTSGFVYTSDSGVAGPWLQQPSSFGITTKYFSGRFWRTGNSAGYSTDGRNWLGFSNRHYATDIFTDSNLIYLVADSEIQLSPGSFIFPGVISSSSDGINFGPSTMLPTDCTHGLYAQGRYIVCFRSALGSTDATNWFMLGSYGPTVTTDGNVFVKVSPTQGSENPTPGPGYISTSTDFTHWTPVDTVMTGLDGVVHNSSQFVAVGPTTYTSTNGNNWSSLGSPPLLFSDENFRCTYGGGTFVAWWVNSPHNFVWYSKDGINWAGSVLPPPTPLEFIQGATSAVTEITNIQYINGRFWMLNSSAGGTAAGIFTSTDGSDFSTSGMNNTFSNFGVFSYDQLLYVPDSNKYYIFGLGSVGTPTQQFFTTSTPDPTDSTIVLTDHTILTGNLANVPMYNGENIAYGDPNFADPGGFDFAYNNGHFVGGTVGGGNGFLSTPPFSYLMWSSDGATWAGLPINGYMHVLSNLSSNDSFRIEGWNNFEIVASYARTILPLPPLLQFNAEVMDHQSVLLAWKYSTTGDTREFVIQRSTPNSAWVTLDSVPMTNQDMGTSSYQYTDRSPVKGVNDYRLMLENKDGPSSFSPVRQVEIHGQAHLAVFPNPAQSQLVVLSDPAITATVTLYSSDGKLVKQQVMSGTEMFMSLTGLPAGMYHLVIRQADGTVDEREVLHVQ